MTTQLENITLHLGDCLNVMSTLPDKSVDFILTDIPYELNLRGGAGGFSDRKLIQKKERTIICILFRKA